MIGSIATTQTRDVIDPGDVGRRSAQAATVLTVCAAAALGTFFAIGEPWGTLNDALSIGLAAATVPVAVGLARRNARAPLLTVGAGLDVIGAVVASTFTALLIARRMTFEESLMGVMAGQALMGAWLVTVGMAAWPNPATRRLAVLALLGGGGLIAGAAGVATGGMDSPFAAVGWIAGLIGTTGSYALLGRRPRTAG